MADFYIDQAQGLRRLLGGESIDVVAFLASAEGAGNSSTVLNVGVHLARLGRRVLLIDEHSAAGNNLAARVGQTTKGDFAAVCASQCSIDDALCTIPPGMTLLAADSARLTGVLASPLWSAQQPAPRQFSDGALDTTIDTVLIDAATLSTKNGETRDSPFVTAAQHIVLVADTSAAAASQAYQHIKRLSAQTRRFHLLVNHLRQEHQARFIFDKLSTVTAQRHIAQLNFLGSIRDDAQCAQTRAQTPFVIEHPKNPAALDWCQVAQTIHHWPKTRATKNGKSTGYFYQNIDDFLAYAGTNGKLPTSTTSEDDSNLPAGASALGHVDSKRFAA